MSLTVADIFWPISTRSRWGTWMYNAHGCISGLILHGVFQTKFLGILYHQLSTFTVIRRGAGSFKCHFWIFEILENFLSWLGAMLWWPIIQVLANISVIIWSFSKIFFTEDKSYQYLQDATSFGLLCAKYTGILEGENSNFGHFSIGWVPYYGIMVRTYTSISLLSIGVGGSFFYER